MQKEKVLLITGLPGIGKTTLAEILLYEKAKFKFKIYLINTIREAEDVISKNDNDKQLFYFDDFLGEVYYQILTGSQKESEISRFVDRIKHTPNKYIILSTRTVIFTQARAKSEKIKRSRIDSGKYEVILNSYSKLEKARILYNHLYFQDIDKPLFDAIIENKFYNEIINSKSYTPRIIEFITDKKRIENFNKEEYLNFILKNLKNPEEIWNDSFQNQIEYFDRCLLFTMFSFQRGITENLLIEAYKERLNYEKVYNNKQFNSEQFNDSVKNLLNGFIISSIIDLDNNVKQFSFINPSVSDFILGYLNQNYEAKKAVILSIKYIEQLEIFNPDKNQFKIEPELQEIIKNKISESKYDSIEKYKEFRLEGYYLAILIKHCKAIDIDSVLLKHLKAINLNYIWWIRKEVEYVLENIENRPQSIEYIKNNFFSIMEKYIEELDDIDRSLKIPIIFKKFGFNFQRFYEEETSHDKLIDLISRVVTNHEKELMSSYKDSVETWDDYDNLIYDKLNDIKRDLFNELCPDTTLDIPRHFEDEELKKQIKINENDFQASIKREKNRDSYYEQLQYKANIENTKIADLFYRKTIE